MRKFASAIFTAVLATSASVALAEQATEKKDITQPIAMTDEQMDKVSAGQLITAVIPITVANNRVAVNVPVAASVAAAVLCGTCSSNQTTGALGRVRQ